MLTPKVENREVYRKFLTQVSASAITGEFYEDGLSRAASGTKVIASGPETDDCLVFPDNCEEFVGLVAQDTGPGANFYVKKAFIFAKAWFGGSVHFLEKSTDELFKNFRSPGQYEQEESDNVKRAEPKGVPNGLRDDKKLNFTTRRRAPKDRYYAIEHIPTKGRGLIATSKVPAGTRVLVDEALFTFQGAEINDPIFPGILQRLEEGQRKEFFSLHNAHHDLGPLVGIVSTNALTTCRRECGLFLRASLLNHSCRPNATYAWNPISRRLTVHALRLIEKGEEITISYLTGSGASEARQRTLKAEYNFRCSCELCSLSPDLLQASDRRWFRIATLEELL